MSGVPIQGRAVDGELEQRIRGRNPSSSFPDYPSLMSTTDQDSTVWTTTVLTGSFVRLRDLLANLVGPLKESLFNL